MVRITLASQPASSLPSVGDPDVKPDSRRSEVRLGALHLRDGMKAMLTPGDSWMTFLSARTATLVFDSCVTRSPLSAKRHRRSRCCLASSSGIHRGNFSFATTTQHLGSGGGFGFSGLVSGTREVEVCARSPTSGLLRLPGLGQCSIDREIAAQVDELVVFGPFLAREDAHECVVREASIILDPDRFRPLDSIHEPAGEHDR